MKRPKDSVVHVKVDTLHTQRRLCGWPLPWCRGLRWEVTRNMHDHGTWEGWSETWWALGL